MKTSSLLIAASLGLNGALLSCLLVREAPERAAPSVLATPETSRLAAEQNRWSALQAALASGDPAALLAAGCSPNVARRVAIGRAFDELLSRLRAIAPQSHAEAKYWQTQPNDDPKTARARHLEERNAPREFSETLHALYGYDLETLLNQGHSPYAFLSSAKREQLRRIERDYADLEAEIEASYHGLQLPSDREKLALLRREKERDLAEILTDEERDELARRSSPSASTVQHRYGSVLRTEEEYKKIFALQKAFDDRFRIPDNADPASARTIGQARMEATPQLHAEIRAALSAEQFAALQRQHDPDRSSSHAIALRLGLPADTGDTVVALRGRYADESQRIHQEPALDPRDREAHLKHLGAKAAAELQGMLSADGASVYLAQAEWIGFLKAGDAFSTERKDAPPGADPFFTVVFRVSPPPAPRTSQGR